MLGALDNSFFSLAVEASERRVFVFLRGLLQDFPSPRRGALFCSPTVRFDAWVRVPHGGRREPFLFFSGAAKELLRAPPPSGELGRLWPCVGPTGAGDSLPPFFSWPG